MPSPNFHFKVGNLDCTVISDGTVRFDVGAVFGLVPRKLWEPVAGDLVDEDWRIPLGLNCLLVRDGDTNVLIDTGMGKTVTKALQESVFVGDYGYLLEGLAADGVRPEDIDVVVNTHLHADHCGWNTLRQEGDECVSTFPRARYYLQKGEYDDASNPNERTRATYQDYLFKPVEAAGQLEIVDGEAQVSPSIRMFETPGHTHHHASLAISSAGETAIYIGDMVQHPAQLGRYAWVSAFDLLPMVSIETKRKLIEDAAAKNTLLIVVHNPFPGVGHMVGEGTRKTWQDFAPRP
jgi:glyoxylase-like metal-dependent hydrolase (beta-lactamase superfamily II)